MGDQLPKISVVTPSYNQGQFLEETIQSVISQQYPNLEYIIIDGGSTDNSVDIIKKYAQHLTYWESEKDRGFGHAINKGFNKATGEIVCWLNSDDIFLPGALNIVGKYFSKHPGAGLLFGDRHVIGVDSKLKFKRQYFFYERSQLRYAKTLPQECTFWRRKNFEAAGPFLREDLKFAIDLELWCRLNNHAEFHHIPLFLGAFRDQPQSKSSTQLDVGLKERREIITKYFSSFPTPMQLKLYQFWLGTLRRIYRATGMDDRKRNSVIKELKS